MGRVFGGKRMGHFLWLCMDGWTEERKSEERKRRYNYFRLLMGWCNRIEHQEFTNREFFAVFHVLTTVEVVYIIFGSIAYMH